MILKILLVIIGIILGLVGSGLCQSAKARDTITMTLEDMGISVPFLTDCR